MKEEYQEIRISRKEIKQKARHTVKTHYFLLCILCLFLSFLAIERGDIINDLRSGYRTLTGQVQEETVSHSLIGSTAISAENVYKAIIKKGIKEGQKEAEEQMEVYEEEPADSGVFSRSNGILSNEGFLKKAPAQKVEVERRKLDEYQKLYQTVCDRLNQLG